MIFTNARVILADAIHSDIEVVVREGKIAELLHGSTSADAIDLRRNYLAPGFVDLHLHGAAGRDTMETNIEAFRAICEHHAGGGTTSLLLTTATAPLEQILSVIGGVRKAGAQIPQIAGVHVEGPFISREKAGAQNLEFIREATPETVERLLEFRDVIKRITIAPEINGALEAIGRFAAAGVSVSGGHSDAWDEEARVGFERGMRSVTHTFNCMSAARRRGPYRIAGLLEYAMSEKGITCELIADGRHVSPTLMKLLYRSKGSDGICLVTDATAGAGLAEGSRFQLYGVECVVIAGVAMLANQLVLAGSTSRMIDLIRTMVRDVGVPLVEAVGMASRNPARQIGLMNKGEIKIGADADLVVISPELEIEQVFVAGQQIYSRRA